MRSRPISHLVDDDGEAYLVREQRDPQKSYGMGAWMITWNESSRFIAKTIKSAPTLRVLHALPDYLTTTDWHRVDQKKLAAELELAQASVSRSLAELHTVGVIERQGKGQLTLWRFSQNYAWKGNLEAFNARRGKLPPGAVHPLGRDPQPAAAEPTPAKPGPAADKGKHENQTRLRLLSAVRGGPRAAAPRND